jgi:hypothetical protein
LKTRSKTELSGTDTPASPTVVDSSYKEIPCRLFRSGTAQGYYVSWLNGREQKCVVRTGDYSIKEPLVIQITGLYINVEKGEYFDVYIPDIQFCKTIGRQCKVTFSYTMTEDLKFPYTISRKEQTIAVVQNKEVPAALIPCQLGAGWGTASRDPTTTDAEEALTWTSTSESEGLSRSETTWL